MVNVDISLLQEGVRNLMRLCALPYQAHKCRDCSIYDVTIAVAQGEIQKLQAVQGLQEQSEGAVPERGLTPVFMSYEGRRRLSLSSV